MRYALAIVAALCVGSTFVGCNSNNSPAASPVKQKPAPEPQQTVNWTLTIKSQCAAATAESCVAGYGFSVLSDGHYQAGPGPNGEMKNGSISPEELSKLNSLASSLTAGNIQAENHEEFPVTDSADTVTLSLGANGAGASTLIKTDGASMSFSTRSFDDAKALLAALKEIAAKYYALPFPDGCADSAASIAKLYASLQSCTADTDCAYFNSSLEVLDPKSNEIVTTDDCSVAKPLAFGNQSAVKANLQKISEALEGLRNSCGDGIFRSDCAGVTSYQLTGAPAVCKQGVCQAPTAPAFR